MTMRELIQKLIDLEIEAEDEERGSDSFIVSGFLLGDGVLMNLSNVFLDGSTLHFDWERRSDDHQVHRSRFFP